MSLTTPFNKPVYPNTSDLSGELPTSRGTDPLIDTGGSGAIQSPFDRPVLSSIEGQETANSVSGLPLQPNRYQPSETPPEPPSIKDRNPGTIDQK